MRMGPKMPARAACAGPAARRVYSAAQHRCGRSSDALFVEDGNPNPHRLVRLINRPGVDRQRKGSSSEAPSSSSSSSTSGSKGSYLRTARSTWYVHIYGFDYVTLVDYNDASCCRSFMLQSA